MRNLEIPWDCVEQEGPGIYNEAYLAQIRKDIMAAEKEGLSVTVNFRFNAPEWTKNPQISDGALQAGYTAAFHHAQRRLKNCKAITEWSS